MVLDDSFSTGVDGRSTDFCINFSKIGQFKTVAEFLTLGCCAIQGVGRDIEDLNGFEYGMQMEEFVFGEDLKCSNAQFRCPSSPSLLAGKGRFNKNESATCKANHLFKRRRALCSGNLVLPKGLIQTENDAPSL